MRVKSFFKILVILFLYSNFHVIKAEPEISLNQDTIDFGIIDEQSENLNKEFFFENTGTETLEIKYLTSTCGCAKAEIIGQSTPPKGGGIINVELVRSLLGTGHKLQQLYFATNDPKNENVTINVMYKANMEDVQISPLSIETDISKQLLLKQFKLGENVIVISDNWENKLEISEVKTSENLATCFYDILYRCPSGGETHILTFKTQLVPNIPVGPINEWLSFKTNHPNYLSVTIPFSGDITGSVKISPQKLLYRNFSIKNLPVVKKVNVTSSSDEASLQLGEITPSASWITVNKRHVDSKKQTLEITVDVDNIELAENKNPIAKQKINVEITSPDKEVKTIDVVILKDNSWD